MNGLRAQGPFPRLSLRDLEGRSRPIHEAWSDGPALLLIGHGDCSTTRLTLPVTDRIHRRGGGRVLLVLQDEVEAARTLQAELGLAAPIRLEADPYPLAQQLGLSVVPTLFLLDAEGAIAKVSEGFSRADLEALGQRLGAPPPLFGPEDDAPDLRPG